ncbi:hypothetical protein VTO73DRAFT_14514 [Trametes versicolor]
MGHEVQPAVRGVSTPVDVCTSTSTVWVVRPDGLEGAGDSRAVTRLRYPDTPRGRDTPFDVQRCCDRVYASPRPDVVPGAIAGRGSAIRGRWKVL